MNTARVLDLFRVNVGMTVCLGSLKPKGGNTVTSCRVVDPTLECV